MLNGLSYTTAADTTSNVLLDAHLSRPVAANTVSVDRATQTDPTDHSDQANALFKKIFDDDDAWRDTRERPAMLSAMAGVSLEMRGFHGTTVMLYQASADSSLPDCCEEPQKARLLHVIHGGARNTVMAMTSAAVGVDEAKGPPAGFAECNVAGATEALRRALTPSRDWSAGTVDDFRRSLRGAMHRLVDDDPEKLLRLAQAGIRQS